MISVPAAILLGLWTLGLGVTVAKHGQKVDQTYNVWAAVLARVIWISLLYWGGFFG